MEPNSGGRSHGEADARRARSAAGLACADVTDALGRLHRHRAHIAGLVSPVPTRQLFGRVITISFFPTCTARLGPEEFNFGRLFHQAMQGAATDPAHTVLVMASNGHTGTSLAGGTKLSRLGNAGLAGVLTDGRLRDFDELAAEPYAAWCSGEAVAWGGGEVTPFQANVPVVLAESVCIPDSTFSATPPGPCSSPKPTSTRCSKPRTRSEGTTLPTAP